MKILYLPDFSDIDIRVLGDLLDVAFPRRSVIGDQALAGSMTYLSNSALMLAPIAREYTSNPRKDRCNAKDPASRFHGFESTIAAFRAHSAPSSPMYLHQSEMFL